MWNKQSGLSTVGVIIAVVIVGAVAASVVPMMLSKNTQSMQGSDRQALDAAKTAIISYALSTGKLPQPVDSNGNKITGAAGLMPPSAGPGAVPQLGVNNWGASGRENPFHLDVNNALILVSTATLCQSAQIAQTAAGPSVCQDTASVTSACASPPTPMAFVLYSTGSDHIANQKNLQTTNTRIYESENRGIENSAGATHYDDLVASYPLYTLVSACAKMGLLPAAPTTPAAQKTISIVNNSSHKVWYDVESGTNCNSANLQSIDPGQTLLVSAAPDAKLWESSNNSCSGDIIGGQTSNDINQGHGAAACTVVVGEDGHPSESCSQ